MQQVRAKAAHSYKAVHDTFYSVKVLKISSFSLTFYTHFVASKLLPHQQD